MIPNRTESGKLSVENPPPPQHDPSPCVRKAVTVRNEQGLHMRPATKITELAKGFSSRIVLKNGERTANGRSMMELLLLIVEPGHELVVEAVGGDAHDAVEKLAAFLGSDDWETYE